MCVCGGGGGGGGISVQKLLDVKLYKKYFYATVSFKYMIKPFSSVDPSTK